MNPTALVRTVQAERRDGNIKRLAGAGHDHMICADHDARRRIQRRARSILKRLPRPNTGCSPTTPGPCTCCVRPRASVICQVRSQQANRVGAVVFDPHAVSPNEAVFVRARLIGKEKRAHRDCYAPRGQGVIFAGPGFAAWSRSAAPGAAVRHRAFPFSWVRSDQDPSAGVCPGWHGHGRMGRLAYPGTVEWKCIIYGQKSVVQSAGFRCNHDVTTQTIRPRKRVAPPLMHGPNRP